ncbi:MAG: FAD:protein FMN transferase [Armatimonadetes bacterium]|nr:FAD:protein FMN transferase [Armatimonadota bacterium]
MLFVLGLGAAGPLQETPQGLQRFAFSQLHMGVRVDITLYAPDEVTAAGAARAAYSRYAELEQTMSDYRPDSELMRLCAHAGTGPVSVSEDLFLVLSQAQKISELTDGAFDVTASPVVRLWREARRTGEMPSQADRDAALKLVGWQRMTLDPRWRTVDLALPGMLLDLGGIAKGYANDEAIRVMKANGVERAMVQAGGDISVSGPPPGRLGWAITVRGLPDTLYLKHAAVSTSGDTEQFVEIDGVRYSHVVDPRTGLGVTTRIQATVVAGRGLVSDPVATAATVMMLADSQRLARNLGLTLLRPEHWLSGWPVDSAGSPTSPCSRPRCNSRPLA